MIEKLKALEILNKERIENINLINVIENENYVSIEFINQSIIVRDKYDAVYIHWDESTDFQLIEDKLKKTDLTFYLIKDNVMNKLKLNRNLKWSIECAQYYIEDVSHFSEPTIDVYELKEEDADFIYKNMTNKEAYDVDYIKDRIKDGATSGIYVEDELVAWAFTHDDGALGGLNVLENHRRKGYAQNLSLDIISKVVRENGIAYLQVAHGNVKSENLTLKLGFKFSNNINWMEFSNDK